MYGILAKWNICHQKHILNLEWQRQPWWMCNVRKCVTKEGLLQEVEQLNFLSSWINNVNWKTYAKYIIPKLSILCWQSYTWKCKNYNLYHPVPYAFSGKILDIPKTILCKRNSLIIVADPNSSVLCSNIFRKFKDVTLTANTYSQFYNLCWKCKFLNKFTIQIIDTRHMAFVYITKYQ
jgi:hypothetical protein